MAEFTGVTLGITCGLNMILSKLKTCHVRSYLEKVFYLYRIMGGKLLAVSVKKKKKKNQKLSLLLPKKQMSLSCLHSFKL